MLPKMHHAHLHDILVPHETYINDPDDDDDGCDCPRCSKPVLYKTSQVQFKITKCFTGEPTPAPITAGTDGLDSASSDSDDEQPVRQAVIDDFSDESEDSDSSESEDIDPPPGWDQDDWNDVLNRMCDISEGKYLNLITGKDNVLSSKLVVNEPFRLCVLKKDKKQLDDAVAWFNHFEEKDDDEVPQAVRLMRQRINRE
jgi:hypothetical protein